MKSVCVCVMLSRGSLTPEERYFDREGREVFSVCCAWIATQNVTYAIIAYVVFTDVCKCMWWLLKSMYDDNVFVMNVLFS